MDLTTFVAQALAIVYLSIGVGMLVDKKHYKKLFDEVFKDTLGMYLGGIIALVMGFALVTYHNEWVQDWTVLITIIGWLALVKGVMLLAFPGAFLGWTKGMFKPKNLGAYAFVVLVIGLVFGYFGFVA
jgi:hypothetical protein